MIDRCLISFVILVGAPVMTAPAAATQQTQPAQPTIDIREQRARGFIDAINADDPAGYIQYMATNRTPQSAAAASEAQRRDQFRQFKDMMGELRIERVNIVGPSELQIIAETAKGEWFTFSFTFADGPERLVDMIRIESGEGPNGRMLEIEPWESLEDFLKQVRAQYEIPAIAIAVVVEGKIVDSAAVGVRSIDGPDQVTLADKFHWGSVTKSVTGTMLGSLIEDGVLSLALTLGEAFDDIDMLDAYRGVTLEQLMCHRGGIPTYTMLTMDMESIVNPPGDSDIDRRHNFARHVLKETPINTPGSTQAYSNAGVSLAAHVAEVVTGRTWEELVQEHVFDALGLSTAGFGWPTQNDPNQPAGHMGSGPGRALMAVPHDRMPNAMALAPAGWVYSSIEDFARYAIVHLRGLRGADGPIAAATIKRIHTPLPGPGSGERYAFGWGIADRPDPGTECHWHNGSAGTFFAEIRLLPEHDAAVVVLMNSAGPGQWFAPSVCEQAIRHLVLD